MEKPLRRKVLAGFASLTLVASLWPVAVAHGADNADDLDYNTRDIDANSGSINANAGTVGANTGDIYDNYGAVGENAGTVGANYTDAVINVNGSDGEVEVNFGGKVGVNDGVVDLNLGGEIGKNNGTVTNNVGVVGLNAEENESAADEILAVSDEKVEAGFEATAEIVSIRPAPAPSKMPATGDTLNLVAVCLLCAAVLCAIVLIVFVMRDRNQEIKVPRGKDRTRSKGRTRR